MLQSTACNMLSVSNFGPIQNGQIDMRPLTVFVGPSNTGKSYLATLIYAIHSYFSGHKSRFSLRPHTEFDSLLHSLSSDEVRDLNDSLKRMDNRIGEICSGESRISNAQVPEPVLSLIRKIFLNLAGVKLSDEILRCFGFLDEENLCRHGVNSGFQVNFQTSLNGMEHLIEHKLSLEHGAMKFQTNIPDEMPLWFDDGIVEYSRIPEWGTSSQFMPDSMGEKITKQGKRFLHLIADYYADQIFHPFNQSAFYLPSDRASLMHVFKQVISGILDSAVTNRGILPDNKSTISGIVSDFLKNLMVLNNSMSSRHPDSGGTKEIIKISKQIEKEIIEGSILTDHSDFWCIPKFRFRPIGWDSTMELKNTSSMVSELTPVVFYLRHIVDTSDVLIIEEPESHLHPSMQVALTRQLASLANSGVRVIVTTHSEWIMEELANLVNLSKLSKSNQLRIDRDRIALGPEDVGAYLFKKGSDHEGTTVAAINLDESNLYPTGFDDVAIELHNKSAKIFNYKNTNG